jgi:hypothetical protein
MPYLLFSLFVFLILSPLALSSARAAEDPSLDTLFGFTNQPPKAGEPSEKEQPPAAAPAAQNPAAVPAPVPAAESKPEPLFGIPPEQPKAKAPEAPQTTQAPAPLFLPEPKKPETQKPEPRKPEMPVVKGSEPPLFPDFPREPKKAPPQNVDIQKPEPLKAEPVAMPKHLPQPVTAPVAPKEPIPLFAAPAPKMDEPKPAKAATQPASKPASKPVRVLPSQAIPPQSDTPVETARNPSPARIVVPTPPPAPAVKTESQEPIITDITPVKTQKAVVAPPRQSVSTPKAAAPTATVTPKAKTKTASKKPYAAKPLMSEAERRKKTRQMLKKNYDTLSMTLRIDFPAFSSALPRQARLDLQDRVSHLKPEEIVALYGSASMGPKGTPAAARAVAQSRMDRIVSFLGTLGVTADRIITIDRSFTREDAVDMAFVVVKTKRDQPSK